MKEDNENENDIENNENEIKDNIDNNENIIQNQDKINNENENVLQNQENIENNNENENVLQNIENNNENENIIQNENHDNQNNNENILQENQNNNENIIQNENNIQNQNQNEQNNNNNQINNNNNNNNNNINGQEVVQNNQEQEQQNNNNNNNIINNNNNNNIREQENQQIVASIKSKIKEIKDKYNFTIQFYEIMNKILKNLQDLTYEKVTNSINECNNYFSFFKNSSELYSKFAEQINSSNNIIMSKVKAPKMNDDFLLEVMQKTQNILFQNLLKISNGLKQNILSKGPLLKVQEKVNKIDNIKKNNINKLKNIEDTKKKVQKGYQKYEKLFELYVPTIKLSQSVHINRNRNPLPSLIDTPDFVYVSKSLIEIMNKLILDINLYIVDLKDSFCEINALFVEMNNLLRDAVLLYIRESKKLFNLDMTKNFEEIENYYKKLEETKTEKMFLLSRIFNTSQNQEIMQKLLQEYYVLLLNSERVKNELLTDQNNFSIHKHGNILLFFEWLISVSPQPTDIVVDDLIKKKMKVKRDPGLFKAWKDSVIIFTKQQHLLLYDSPMNADTFVKIFELDKISYRKKAENNKKPFMFELIANRKGKLMDFKGTFLFDGLNGQNIEEIPPLVYNAYNQ